MKIVRASDELDKLLAIARSEANKAFGNDAVYVERYVDRPRHIEFQIAADLGGRVVHLGERECSVQRRYQKLVEESPSPAMTDDKRRETGARIVAALEEIGYANLGTVELLMDERGELYFMEMNTRIQVEHPVTEMVTGHDLVRLQIALAAGQSLPFTQEEIELSGHAIECRINAEHPRTFAPSPGRITTFHVPGGPGVRVDTHVTQDTVVSPHYDSLLAKLIVHDVDRAHAIRRMRCALREFVVEGIDSNLDLQRDVLDAPAFTSGRYDTKIVEELHR